MFRWRVALMVGSIALLHAAPGVRADVASDEAAAIVVFPKILVDTTRGLDTYIRLSNTSDREVSALCFYIDVTPQCTLPTRSCFPDPSDCHDAEAICQPQWQETDFKIRVTTRQPVAWLASQGARDNCIFLPGVCSNDPNQECEANVDCGRGNHCVLPPCFPLEGRQGSFQGREGPRGESNSGSAVAPVPEDPFIGELKCIAVDENLAPIPRNVLEGEVLIGYHGEGVVDVAGYNAIGIPAIPERGNRDNVLVIGGPRDPDQTFAPQVEYEGCPNILILDHFFDGAVDPLVPNFCQEGACSVSETACLTDADCRNQCDTGTCTISGQPCDEQDDCLALVEQVRVATDLTLIPCTEDFLTQNPARGKTVAQFLVFNEFEQRYSTSTTVNCFLESRLSNIGSTQNERSIFSAGVTGTMTGQTRIRGVDVGATDRGNTFLGVAEEFRCTGPGFPLCSFTNRTGLVSSNASNLHFQGTRAVSDFMYLP
jgi:hypothetical protein